jgi:hypothetical protein
LVRDLVANHPGEEWRRVRFYTRTEHPVDVTVKMPMAATVEFVETTLNRALVLSRAEIMDMRWHIEATCHRQPTPPTHFGK